jgi:hypothetical protein
MTITAFAGFVSADWRGRGPLLRRQSGDRPGDFIRRLRLHRRAFAQLLHTLDDDAFSGLEAFQNDRFRADPFRRNFNGALRCLVIGADDHTKFLPCNSVSPRSGIKMLPSSVGKLTRSAGKHAGTQSPW